MPPVPNKRVPVNPRYQRVTSRIDTGPNMRKILAQYEGTSGPYAHVKKSSEWYMTLRPTTLAKLLEPAMEGDEKQSIYNLDLAESVSSPHNAVPTHSACAALSHSGAFSPGETRSEGGYSEVASEAPEGGNLVIYDLRPLSEYERCHIHGARHFDPLQLKKSANQFPREAYYYKGGAESEKMIVLYDGDGKVCACTRNFDRIWRTLPPSQCSPFGTLC